jgi:ATP-dependent Lon protease
MLAARRAGITRIILQKNNVKDLEEIDAQLREEFEFIPVSSLDDVFLAAFS